MFKKNQVVRCIERSLGTGGLKNHGLYLVIDDRDDSVRYWVKVKDLTTGQIVPRSDSLNKDFWYARRFAAL